MLYRWKGGTVAASDYGGERVRKIDLPQFMLPIPMETEMLPGLTEEEEEHIKAQAVNLRLSTCWCHDWNNVKETVGKPSDRNTSGAHEILNVQDIMFRYLSLTSL